ncbi:sugar nucleotide-binding protein [Kordiimonas sp.]|uniref:sugar nucleotide-binding protein n=1 Tax=Kordiimonas sp. TaxID=1970157 RepID=UPI003A8CF410
MKTGKKILVLGGTGMLGWATASILSHRPDYNVTATYNSSQPLNLPHITWQRHDCLSFQPNSIEGFDYVINCLGLIRQRIGKDNLEHHIRAIAVNAQFPHRLALACEKYDVKCIAIATDCVFSGLDAPFKETNPHTPTDIYAASKSLGEVSSDNMAHIRCSVVGQEWSQAPVSLMSWILSQPSGKHVSGYIDHLWNGVTNMQFAKVLAGMIEHDIFWSGTQHLVPGSKANKAELLKIIASSFGRTDIVIEPAQSGHPSNRLLATIDESRNSALWQAAGYDRPPSIPAMIQELASGTAQIQPQDAI